MRTIRLLMMMICLTAATAQARVKYSAHQHPAQPYRDGGPEPPIIYDENGGIPENAW